MNWNTFEKQVERLRDCFGEARWSQEKVRTIWPKVERLDDRFFIEAVDFLVAESNTSPKLSEINNAYRDAKNIDARNNPPTLESEQIVTVFDDSERAMMIRNCVLRGQGKMRDDEWIKFRRDMDDAIRDRTARGMTRVVKWN